MGFVGIWEFTWKIKKSQLAPSNKLTCTFRNAKEFPPFYYLKF